MAKKITSKKHNTKLEFKAKTTGNEKGSPLVRILYKFLIFSAIIFTIVFYVDKKGYFTPDNKNNHTLRKWDSFYNFTNENDVDLLLLGNSHLYTGINPKNLSTALGINAFILASPGTNISDSYFSLQEALTRCTPKIVIVETYSIGNSDPHDLKEGGLSDAFKSFAARRNVIHKLISTPYLFTNDNYIYAWSNSIRNHDYLFTNPNQIRQNIKDSKLQTSKTNDDLYLGRFVSSTAWLKDSTLAKYETNGAPCNGEDYKYSKSSAHYVSKIAKLCQQKGIKLLFLTIPMYEKHISHYDVWKNTLNQIISKYPSKWCDLQEEYKQYDFDTLSFENTYSENQHLTYYGSLISTYALVDFIRNEYDSILPNRYEEKKWITDFYGEEGYFENRPIIKTDTKHDLVELNKTNDLSFIDQCIVDKTEKKTYRIYVKIKKEKLTNTDIKTNIVRTLLRFKDTEGEKFTQVDFIYDKYHTPANEVIYFQTIIPIEVKEILKAALLSKKTP